MVTRSATPSSTLPAELTSFVGRRQDIAAIRQLFSTARLVTLTGIGGVGKTRLALHVAQDVRRAFPDNVCLVELAGLQEPDLLPHTVIDALGIREHSTRAPMTVVCDYLRQRRMLLVLDNCKHLVEAAADLVDRVLRAAAGVKVLATSRQALRITSEHVYTVPPLPAPDPGAPLEPGTATQYPSVALFAERSAAVVDGFTLTPDNEAAVIRLCRRLEGIPLAIELASVRLRVLTVDELANRLDDRFQLLREGSRNLPGRHQTLQALIDWSFDLCTPSEQALWARASVFADGFSTDALEAVCADEALPEHTVLDTVSGLLDKSIVTREDNGEHVRFRMLETIRIYGQARLAESEDEVELGRRHRDWYQQLLATADAEWVGPRQQEWASKLRLEHANLRRALEHCLSQPGEARNAQRMAAVPWFWGALGHLTEGALWLDRALALDEQPTKERAWALATAAYVAAFQGNEEAVTTRSEEARNLAVQLDDPSTLAYTTHVLGFRHVLSGELADAIPLFTEALWQYAETNVPAQYQNDLRMELATVYIFLGELDKADSLVDELLERCHAAGERLHLSYALWLRAFLKLIRDEPDGAEADLCQAIQIKRTFNDTLGLALALDSLAWAALAKGDPERSATLLGGANTLWQTIGSARIGSEHLIARRDQCEKAARQTMGNDAFDVVLQRGGALTIEEALALALRERTQPPPTTPHTTPALTRREHEVATLVAEGLPNKEIATRLVISPRTAEAHVENILTKLGFTTRTQIANWVMQQHASGT